MLWTFIHTVLAVKLHCHKEDARPVARMSSITDLLDRVAC